MSSEPWAKGELVSKQHYEPTVPASQVTQQKHYTALSPQPRTVATKWGLMCDTERFNALKYIARAEFKGSFHEDLAKAADWLMWRLMRDRMAGLLNDLADAARRYAGMVDEKDRGEIEL